MSEFYFLAHSVLTACTTRSFDVYRYAMPRVCDDRPRRGSYVHTCFRRINQPHDFRNAFILRWCKEIWRDGEKKKQHLNLRVGFYAWNSLRVFQYECSMMLAIIIKYSILRKCGFLSATLISLDFSRDLSLVASRKFIIDFAFIAIIAAYSVYFVRNSYFSIAKNAINIFL